MFVQEADHPMRRRCARRRHRRRSRSNYSHSGDHLPHGKPRHGPDLDFGKTTPNWSAIALFTGNVLGMNDEESKMAKSVANKYSLTPSRHPVRRLSSASRSTVTLSTPHQ